MWNDEAMEGIASAATRFLESNAQAVWRGLAHFRLLSQNFVREFQSEVVSRFSFRFLAMAESAKIPKMMKKIGTHSGVFHCDEALACFLLKQLPEYKDAEVVRTRNPEVSRLSSGK